MGFRPFKAAWIGIIVVFAVPSFAQAAIRFTAPFLVNDTPGPNSGVVLADLDVDGKQDLLTISTTHQVSVALGHGDGSFGTRHDYDVGSAPNGVATGDLNADGRPDVAVAASSGWISIFLTLADGTLGQRVDYVTTSEPGGVAIGDLNADGKLDLVYSLPASNTVVIRLGLGNGTFAPTASYLTGPGPQTIRLADLNSDSRLDVVVVNTQSLNNAVSVLLGHGDGTLSPKHDYAMPSPVSLLNTADFTEDGFPDLAAVCFGSGLICILPSIGDGTFGARIDRVSSNPTDVAGRDVDGDGHADLIVSHQERTITVARGLGNGSFQADIASPAGRSPARIAIGQIDNSGGIDVVVVSDETTTASILLNNDAGSFGTDRLYNIGGDVTGLVSGDLNGDGRTDVATVTAADSLLTIFLTQADGTLAQASTMHTGKNPMSAVIADLNGDGKLDVAVGNAGLAPTFIASLSIFMGNGVGGFSRTDLQADHVPNDIDVGDFDNDGIPDLITLSAAASSVSIWRGNGNGTFQAAEDFPAGIAPRDMGLADIDNDGDLDVVVASFDTQGLSLLLGNGNGQLALQSSPPLGTPLRHLVIGDFDGDNHVDVAACDNLQTTLLVLRGLGAGAFAAPIASYAGNGANNITVGDLNNDGVLDLLLTDDHDEAIRVLDGNKDGSFVLNQAYGAAGNPRLAVIADVNKDGRPDIIFVAEASRTIGLRYNIADIPTAIELVLFDAQRIGGSIEVRWQLAATNVADKVTLERSLTQEGPWTTAFVQEGESGTLIVATIPDVDPTVGGYYRLRVQEIGGQYRIFGPIELTASRSNLIPTLSVWPQPARSAIEMRFVLPMTDYVRLDMLDIQGRIVASPVDGVVREGSHVLAWKPQEGRSLVSGLYFIRFVTSRYTVTSRLTIVR